MGLEYIIGGDAEAFLVLCWRWSLNWSCCWTFGVGVGVGDEFFIVGIVVGAFGDVNEVELDLFCL